MKQIAVAVYPQEGITPYDLSGNLDVTASYSNPFSVDIIDLTRMKNDRLCLTLMQNRLRLPITEKSKCVVMT